MTPQPRKMSEIIVEMADRLFRNPDANHSSEAAQVALLCATIAWNETILGIPRTSYGSEWKQIEGGKPEMWGEFKLNDVDAMIDELVQFKKQYYPDDQRRILAGGIPNGRVRVEWLPAAAPGVDAQWEMTLYGLVRMGEREKAIQFLQDTRRVSRNDAAKRVVEIASDLGIV